MTAIEEKKYDLRTLLRSVRFPWEGPSFDTALDTVK
jgi:hypothetical protein